MDTTNWEKIAVRGEGSSSRDSHSCVVIKDKMYIIGGLSCEAETNDVFEFDLTQEVWSKWPSEAVEEMKPRESHVSWSFEDRYVFVHGGTSEENLPMEESFICVLDVDKQELRRIENWENQGVGPCERESHSCSKMGDYWYFYGGRPVGTAAEDGAGAKVGGGKSVNSTGFDMGGKVPCGG